MTDDPDIAVSGVLRNFIEACIFAISQNNHLTVEYVVENYDSSANVTSVLSPSAQVTVDGVIEESCPGGSTCSGHGNCTSGRCVCEAGYVIISSFYRLVV